MFRDLKSQLLLLYGLLAIGVVLLGDLRYIVMLTSASVAGGLAFIWYEYVLVECVRPNNEGRVHFAHTFVSLPSKTIASTISANITTTRQINIEKCTPLLVDELLLIFHREREKVALEHVSLSVLPLDMKMCERVIEFMKTHTGIARFHIQTALVDDNEEINHLNSLLSEVPSDRKISVGYAMNTKDMICTNAK